jgi:plasmid stability protein
MSQILIRKVDPKTVQKLKDRAKTAGRSFESEARLALDKAAAETPFDPVAFRRKLRAFHRQLKGRKFTDSAELIREDRDR